MYSIYIVYHVSLRHAPRQGVHSDNDDNDGHNEDNYGGAQTDNYSSFETFFLLPTGITAKDFCLYFVFDPRIYP